MALMVFAICKLLFLMCMISVALIGMFAMFAVFILCFSSKPLAKVEKNTSPLTHIQSLVTVNQSASSLCGEDHGVTESHGDM